MLSEALVCTEDMLHKRGDGQESPAQTAEEREVTFGMNVRLLHCTYVCPSHNTGVLSSHQQNPEFLSHLSRSEQF